VTAPRASSAPATLVELLRARASATPDASAYTFLVDGDATADAMTCGELDRRARRIAVALERAGVARGERALLLYPPGLDYIAAFFGCLYAGVIAVPVYPPRHDRSLLRLQAIAIDATASAGLIRDGDLAMLRQVFAFAPALERIRWIATDETDRADLDGESPRPIAAEDLAFLQYTSGSTSTPKGVMLSHRNLIHNLGAIARAFRIDHSSRAVIWLPPYHDMGLIGGILQPLYGQFPVVLMSPLDFLKEPYRWLKAISVHRATITGGPDFAYNLCLRKITAAQRQALDLSSLQVAFNGAEPIRADTLARFSEAFAPCGFRSSAFYPCYGLAESTLIVTGGPNDGPRLQAFDGPAMQRGRAVPAPAHAPQAKLLVSSGSDVLDGRVVVVDPDTRAPAPDRAVGEIWVSAPSVAAGYWGQPEASARDLRATLAGSPAPTFLRTGDLGFFSDGQLYVTGRSKDLIIIRGVNHYPQDIELTVERAHPALRPGSGAAFSVDTGDGERLVIVQEVSAGCPADALDGVLAAIRRRVAEAHELAPCAIALLAPGALPKTSSGKVQRHASRDGFLADSLAVRARFVEPPRALAGAGAAAATGSAMLGEPPRALADVADAVSAVLGEPLSPAEPARALGLDSLTTVELQHRLEQRLGVAVPLGALLRCTTLADVGAAVGAARAAAEAHAPAPRTEPAAELGDAPLSPGQQALWFQQHLIEGTRSHSIAAALRVRGLDPAMFARVLDRLVQRHAALRTTFPVSDGLPVQRVAARGAVEFAVHDAARWTAEQLDARLRDEAGRAFDLERGPLVRVCVLACGRDDHAVLVVVHHLVADFWSLATLARELSTLYFAESNGVAVELTPTTVSYAQLARDQVQRVAGESGEHDWRFWERALTGPPPVLSHLADRPRPPRQTHAGARCTRALDAALADQLKALSRDRGATLFSTLLAGYHVLLHRHTGQNEIWVGSPTAGRDRADTADVVGYFANPVILRAEVAPDDTFAALLERVHAGVQDALAHAGMPLLMLAERLRAARQGSQSPLFQTMFVLYQPLRRSEPALTALALGLGGVRFSLGGLPVESLPLELGTSPFDLSLCVAEVGRELHVSLEYDVELFERATAERLLRRYEAVLRAVAGGAAGRVGALAIDDAPAGSPPTARRAAAAAPVRCVHQLIEDQARNTPDAIALRGDGRALSYRELDERSNGLAWQLRDTGVRAGDLVALYVERSPEQIAAVLAILKAGAAFVPLDPEFSVQRLVPVIEGSGLCTVIARSADRAQLARAAVRFVDVDAPVAARPSPPAIALSPQHLAYVTYTSGSSGRPKGVMISHGALAGFIRSAIDRYGIRSGDRLLQFNSLSFDASLEEMFDALVCGAELALRTPAMLDSVAGFLRGCEALAITVADLPTAFWHTVTDALEHEQLAIPACLRLMLVGGERIRPDRVAQWRQRVPPEVRLINVYGPTEATIVTTAHDIAADEPLRDEVPIGRPLATTDVYVLDDELRPIPAGIVGELWIAGSGLATGYLGDPATTAERFVPDPFAPHPGARMYRSGDRARRRDDGAIEYISRTDDQVKIRGFRVEIAEVASVVRTCDGVREVLICKAADPSGHERLVAYVVAAPRVTPVQLRAHAAARLPSYMVPAAWVRMDAFPMSSAGKVDRRALPPAGAAGAAAGELERPRTQLEELVAGIWAELLNVERVGPHAHFFELGGHSLLAMKLMARVRGLFGVELPVRALFEGPTVAELSAAIERAIAGAPASRARPIARVGRGAPLPVSFAQQRLWLQAQLDPQSTAYHVPGTLHLRGPLDAAALERAFRLVVARHETLRTRFAAIDGEPMQIVDAQADFEWAINDLRELAGDARTARARALIDDVHRRPFDLEAGPLLRVRVIRLADDAHAVAVALHHVVCDAWSLGVLLSELSALYGELRAGRSPSPQPPERDCADFAVWQRQLAADHAWDAALDYWRDALRAAPPALELPIARARGSAHAGPCEIVRRPVPAATVQAIRRLSRSEGASTFMIVLAAYQALLHRYSGEPDLVIGTSSIQRPHPALEATVGFFVNMLPLRARIPAGATFRDLLRQARDTSLRAFAHQDVPYEQIVEAAGAPRGTTAAPFLQIMFVFNTAAPALELAGVEATLEEAVPGTAKCDLLLEVTATGDGLAIAWELDAARFDAAAIARLAEHFEILFDAALCRPDAPIARLPLVIAEQAYAAVSAAHEAVDPDGDLIAAIDARAARDPQAIACALGERELRFGELVERATALAHALRRRGVGRETVVGVYLPRSPELVIATLAILKAGGAYLALDVDHPPERLRFMIEDARAALVCTDGAPAALPTGVALLDVTAPPDAGAGRGVPIDGDVDGRQLAYIMYTSGSTGQPKGVMIERAALWSYVRWARDAYELDRGDGAPVHSSVAFDLTVTSLFVPLAAGRCVVLVPEQRGVGALARALRERGNFSLVKLTPTHLGLLAQELAPADAARATRAFVIGGEQLVGEALAFWRAHAPATRLINEYGPTETVVGCCVHVVTAADGATGPVPIGVPIAGARLLVLDPALEPVPAGVPGELYVAGAGVGRGYLRQPALTAARFVPDPGAGGARMYRTGDRVRQLASGELEFLGRTDQQIKLRGHRIELGELEQVLLTHPAVGDAAALAVGRGPEAKLVAHVAPRTGAAITALELRRYLQARLPAYMVPAGLAVHDRFPLTTNGKVDRDALAAAPIHDDRGVEHVATTAVEAALVAMWSAVLERPHVGMHDSFLELGGDSLSAMQILSRVRDQLGVEVSIEAMFERGTIAALASEIEAARAASPSALPLAAIPRGGPLACSHSQQRLWVVAQLDPDSAAYHIAGGVHLTGALDVEVLERCLNTVVERHEVLRTSFVLGDGGPVQIVYPALRLPLPVDDLRGLTPAAERERADALGHADATRPFDLARPPLVRVRLVRVGEHAWLLRVVLHHIVADGWSIGVMFREIAALYEAYSRRRPSPLRPLAVQYADFAHWQRQLLHSDAARASLAYWRDHLQGAPACVRLPLDRPRPEIQTTAGRASVGHVDPAITQALQDLAQDERATAFQVTLAAFYALLAQVTGGQDDLVVGTPIANRPHPLTEDLIGFFVNTLPLRCRVDLRQSFRELLRAVQRITLEAYKHQDVPFERIVADLGVERSTAYGPLVQVLFAFQNMPWPEIKLGDLTIGELDADFSAVKFDIVVMAQDDGDRLRVTWTWNADLFDPDSVIGMQRRYAQLLAQVTAAPDAPLGQLAPAAPPAAAPHAVHASDFEMLKRAEPIAVAIAVAVAVAVHIEEPGDD
jgi:amino acid adenylation domain-containing protein